uniref:Putative endonuclease-reverse transcriptase n=1 Tax=Rhipicephalus microplus TaxID=6941 RepID=A0A6G5A915_RHIMP
MITEQNHRESRRVCLKIIMHKTKVMCNNLGRKQHFAIGGEMLEVVKEYVHLGQIVTVEPNPESEITRRIRMGWIAFGKHSQIMNGNLPLTLKRKVYNKQLHLASAYLWSRNTEAYTEGSA